jgi:hypothetical protein
MIEIVKDVSAIVATCCEFTAVVVIVVGALQALVSIVKTLVEWKTTVSPLLVFRGFAGWLVLALVLERRRSRHPHPKASQGGVCEVAVAGVQNFEKLCPTTC